ncbi:MAG: hypothetical protein ACK56I_31780, partial [bacterium]
GDQRSGEILTDVLVGRHPVDADGVVGKLLSVDELLAARLADVAHAGQRAIQLGRAVAAVGVGAAGPVDGLQDEGEPDPLRGGPGLGGGAHPARPRHPQAGGGHPLRLPLLVAVA